MATLGAPSQAHSGTVIALGVKTYAWKQVATESPSILNCCVDVRSLLGREWDEDTRGSGYDDHVRERIRAKGSWEVILEVSATILHALGLLIVLCNHGKHRSLSVAIELEKHFGCRLISSRVPGGGYRPTCDVLRDVRERLAHHSERFGHLPSPIVGTHRCIWDFDGTAWALGESAEYRLCNYLTISRGDVLVVITRDPDIA